MPLAASITGLTAQLAAKGNCQAYTSRYDGSGRYGPSNPIRINFSKPPLGFLVVSSYGIGVFVQGANGFVILGTNQVTEETTSWIGNTVSWYHDSGANEQLNTQGASYHMLVLLES